MVCGALMQYHRLTKLRRACITGDLPAAKCAIAEGVWINAKDLVRCLTCPQIEYGPNDSRSSQPNVAEPHTPFSRRHTPPLGHRDGFARRAGRPERLPVIQQATARARDREQAPGHCRGYAGCAVHPADGTSSCSFTSLLSPHWILLYASIRQKDGRTPLHLACKFGHTTVVEKLAAARVDVNRLDSVRG
jgi:hypothetical protein